MTSLLHVGSIAALNAPEFEAPYPAPDIYFEGPEKKLEVFFSGLPNKSGFRHFPPSVWSDVLSEAHCSILHSVGNEAFDAYLLSESSLFVYPHKLILKTCGSTTLLLVLPKVLALAQQLGATLSHVHYSHFRFAHPQLQPYPHSSFTEEEGAVAKLLHGHIGGVSSQVLGERGGADDATRWYALCADGVVGEQTRASPPVSPPTIAPPFEPSPAPLTTAAAPLADVETPVLEVAMEGLAPAVCALFIEGTHKPLAGKALAKAMTSLSGIGALVPDATIDDWAFEPCGYSMNAMAGRYYYTVHITPELGFSYASFETNDPAFATDEYVARILDVFQPTTTTVTLTTHGNATAAAPALAEPASQTAQVGTVHPPTSLYNVACAWETVQLSSRVAVASASYVRIGADETAMSNADSESTAPLDESAEVASQASEGCDDSCSDDTPAGEGGKGAKRPCVKRDVAKGDDATASAASSSDDELGVKEEI